MSKNSNYIIAASVIYDLPIDELKCIKLFLDNIHETGVKLNKSHEWEFFVKDKIKQGMKVVFQYLGDTEKTELDEYGVYYPEMIFEVFLGFKEIGNTLYHIGELLTPSTESLIDRYENNPDFIFTELDWKTTKEEAIKFFLEEECKYDFVEDIPQTIPNAN